MKYAMIMGLMGGTLMAGSFVYPSLRFVLIWSAIRFGVVALGYAGLGPKVLVSEKTEGFRCR